MSKRIFILFVFFIFTSVRAQDNLKVFYQMEIISNSTYASVLPKVDCVLLIQDSESKFNMYYDIAEKKHPGEIYPNRLSVYKNFNKNEMFGRIVGYKNNEYIIKDSLTHVIEWELKDSLKVINKKKCKLATANWRGHYWEAWYDESIPVSDGPYKIHGLPGLVVEAKAKSCSGIIYHFISNSIEYTDQPLKSKIYFPFVNKQFKIVEYSKIYKRLSEIQMNGLKNSDLKNKENVNDPTLSNRQCVSAITLDFCFCYP